jgi:hypothetical protein
MPPERATQRQMDYMVQLLARSVDPNQAALALGRVCRVLLDSHLEEEAALVMVAKSDLEHVAYMSAMWYEMTRR